MVEGRTVTPLRQVRFPGAARDFSPTVNSQCRLSFGVRTPSCAIACINICTRVKDPVLLVRVRWIMATQTYPARTVSEKNNLLDDCGRSTERRRRGKGRGQEGRFSRDHLPVFFARGLCEQFWHRQRCPLFGVVHPAFPLTTTASPTFLGAL